MNIKPITATTARAQTLRARAADYARQANQAEASARAIVRKRRDRAAYVVGGWLLRNDAQSATCIAAQLNERDRAVVVEVLGQSSQSASPHAHIPSHAPSAPTQQI